MRPVLLLAAAAAVGCARKRDPAPTEVKELTHYLFLHWEEEELLPEAVDNMADRMFDFVDTEDAEDGLVLGSIPDSVADAVPHPDVANETIGVIGAERSDFGLADHSTHMSLPDQVWSNPGTYDKYERTLLEGSGSAFEAEKGVLRTSNDVLTATLGISIPYVLFKDYRWVHGERHDAIVARSWIARRSCNEGGGNCVDHTYSVDLWFADGDHAAVRATASWSQLETSIAMGEDLQVATLALGIQNVFEYTDRFLAGE